MQIFQSRYTLGVTADQVFLERGERIRYTYLDGEVVYAKVDSDRMCHHRCPNLGYECIAEDNGERFFADGKRIEFVVKNA